MRRFLFPVVAGLAAAALGLSACGATSSNAAKVNDTEISQSSLDDELKAIQKNKAYVDAIQQQGAPTVEGAGKGTFNTAFVAQILSQRILLEVVKQELARMKVSVTDEDLKLGRAEVHKNFETGKGDESLADAFPKSYQDTLAERSADVLKLQAALAGVKIDDAAVSEYYNAHKDQLSETCTRHILVADKAKADALRARIVAGEDFAKVAKAESTDSGSGAQGGELGCDISNFVPEFQNAAKALPVNEISQPVQSQFGYHLIQVTSRKPKPLDDNTKVAIRHQLVGSDSTKLQEAVFSAVSKANVQVDPDIGTYQKGDLQKGEPPRVVPAKPPVTTTTAAPTATTAPSPVTTAKP
jgi:foldase protein PrsA